MGLFGSKSEGGFMDVIRCDEKEYLVYKWRPSGEANSTRRENAIRYGSSLRVKDGEMAVFVYQQKDGTLQDYIVGPYDQTIKTANFPVLSGLVGAAFGGASPFQAEIYFINLAGNVQVKFGVPWFDISDPRLPELPVPCAVRGTLTFNITDYKAFITNNRLIHFELEDLKRQIRDFFVSKVKGVVKNIPFANNVPVVLIENRIEDVSDIIKTKMKEDLVSDFGINLKRIDIADIELDKSHAHYLQLKKATADQQTKMAVAQTDMNILHLQESQRIQRKDVELGVEGKNFAVHQLNTQADILKTAAENLGQMSQVNLGGGVGMNPAGLMAGMAIGGAVGNQMGALVTNIQTPPPVPSIKYFIIVNGQQAGPYELEQLKILAANGQFTREQQAWKEGMSAWTVAVNIPELAALFQSVPPPVPPPLP